MLDVANLWDLTFPQSIPGKAREATALGFPQTTLMFLTCPSFERRSQDMVSDYYFTLLPYACCLVLTSLMKEPEFSLPEAYMSQCQL